MNSLQRTTPFNLPIRVLQFGQGNFLRGFFDWQIDLLNERCGLNAGVVIVRPTSRSTAPLLDSQDGLYTTVVRGLDEQGQAVQNHRLITCVQRELDLSLHMADFLLLAQNPDIQFVVSNTTEAGIATNTQDQFSDAPPSAFPAKLTRWLYARFEHFAGSAASGVVLLPMELIDHNGDALKAAVLFFAKRWDLGSGFENWLQTACVFCSTLVDRIVPGFPADEMPTLETELGYRDPFLVTTEYYHLLLIQGPAKVAEWLKLSGSGLNIHLVDDIAPYKLRKVGILNAGHTAMVPLALLAGLSTVGQAMKDEPVAAFLKGLLFDEVIPTLPLPAEELTEFANEVLRRFGNPFIHHRLASIALNSWSKFAVRVMPQMRQFHQLQGHWPPHMVLALAATMHLYKGELIALSDEAAHLEWWKTAWERFDSGELSARDMVSTWMAKKNVWGDVLSLHEDLIEAITQDLVMLQNQGAREALKATHSSGAVVAA